METRKPPVQVGLDWWLQNEKHWFRVECREGQEEHAFCISHLYGTYFVDHGYASIEDLDNEAKLLPFGDYTGCHQIAAWFEKRLVPVRFIVEPGRAQGATVKASFQGDGEFLPSFTFYGNKSSVFLLQNLARQQNRNFDSRWSETPRLF